MSTTPAPYIGGRPRVEATVVALSSTVSAQYGPDTRITLVREAAHPSNLAAVISLSPTAEAALLKLLLRRKSLRS